MARAGGEIRGSAADRRARRAKLILVYGDGVKVACVHCGCMVDNDGMEVDKIIPGSQGGRYVWANILPSCMHCNRRAQRQNHGGRDSQATGDANPYLRS